MKVHPYKTTLLFVPFLLLIFTAFDCNSQGAEKIFENPFQNIEELAISSETCILEGRHVWVSSEIQTVNPDFTGIGGITSIYSPPLNLSPFQMEVQFFGKKTEPKQYTWKPGEIILSGKSGGVGIKCLLVPDYSSNTLVQVFELVNLNQESILVPVKISANPALSDYKSLWPWSPQKADKKAELKENGGRGKLSFESADGKIEIGSEEFIRSGNELTGEFNLKPGQTKKFTLIVSFSGKQESGTITGNEVKGNRIISESRKRWNERLENAYSQLGKIKTSNPDFDLFYKRGILSLLTCEWTNNEMLLKPYYSESGIDGGAVCSYLWGFAYVSKIMPLYNPLAWKEQIKQGIKTDAENHYAFTPITGESIGPWYSYNQYSTVRAIYDYVLISGDIAFLSETVNNKRVIDYCIEQALFKDHITSKVKLINYGTNHNLLELKKSGTYQFFVPSPNAERCWSYRAVDELCKWADVPCRNFSPRADELAKLITQELWSEEDKWFLTRDTLGNRHFSPSIQIFDMLRCGILSEEQEIKILSHLNETEFLSRYGVHSLSKKDPGYDLNDADWGGPGVYAGDGPELVEDLYLSGHPEKAEDLLKRILWWGKYLPYYPQAIVADKIDYRRNGRANIIAGATSPQSILFGMLGLQFSPDGRTSIFLDRNSLFDTFSLEGLDIRGKETDITIRGDTISVTTHDGTTVQGTTGQRIYF